MLYHLSAKLKNDIKKAIRVQYPRVIPSTIRFRSGVISAKFRSSGARVPLTTYDIERGELVSDSKTLELLDTLKGVRDSEPGPDNYRCAWGNATKLSLPLP